MLKNISIRHLMVLVLIVVIVPLAASLSRISDRNIDSLTEQDIIHADRAVTELLEGNRAESEQILTRLGEQIVAMEAELAASTLAPFLEKAAAGDYATLRKDAALRRLATKAIYAEGQLAGYIDLYDINGVSVLHPDSRIEGTNYRTLREQFPAMWQLISRSFYETEVKGYYPFIDESGAQRKKYTVLRRMAGSPFIVAASVFIDHYFLTLHQRLARQAALASMKAERSIKSDADTQAVKTKQQQGLWTMALLMVFILTGYLLSGFLVRPLWQLAAALQGVGRGNLKEKVPENGAREVRELARAYNAMNEQLISHIETIKEETAARQTMASELAVAAQIQHSLLPADGVPFPNRPEFSLYGVNVPAKEVGGDFFDYFFLDQRRLALIIGDVSGKGVPAALFMAVTRTAFRDACSGETEPGRIMKEVNRVLCRDNDECMFVTVFLAVYHTDSGRFSYANGGHEDCVLVSSEAILATANPGNMALGVDPDQTYTTLEGTLGSGESLFFFTDGVTEARGGDEGFYGAAGLHDFLAGRSGGQVEATCRALADELRQYQGGLLFDDITMIMLRRER